MSQTYWGLEARVPRERLVSWMSSFSARRGERFAAAGAITPSPEDIEWQLSEGHTPEWSRASTSACCIPEVVTALSRELETKVVTVSEQEDVGMECFCVLERGEIRTLFSRGDHDTEKEGVDPEWVPRYFASGLVRVPAGIGPEDHDRYLLGAFVHVGSDVDMKWVWDDLDDFLATHVMLGSSFGQRHVGGAGRGWRATMACTRG